jgi:hypothetical protein
MLTLSLKDFSLVACILCCPSLAYASYLDQVVTTNSSATATYNATGGSAGPYPFTNLGVGASASLGADVGADVAGSTAFHFPSIDAGQTYTSNSGFAYSYTPSWSGGSVNSHAGLTANANFVYDLGPFSGSTSIFSTAVDSYASGGIGGGSTLTGGAANAVSSGPNYTFTLSESAFLASASVGLTVGLNEQTAVTYTPTLEYGYYNWVNTTGGLSAADTVTFHGVSSGPLNYVFPQSLESIAGSANFYDNFLPGVEMQLQITPTTTITFPLTGNFNVSAFGSTLVKSLSLGNLFSLVQNYETWNDDVNWNGPNYYSLYLHEDNSQCQLGVTPTCEVYDVLSGTPLSTSQSFYPLNTTANLVGGGSSGGFNPALNGAPLTPDACDPATGVCYAGNDPNTPVGPGSVTTHVSEAIPEPATWLLFLAGVGAMGVALRSRRRETIGVA